MVDVFDVKQQLRDLMVNRLILGLQHIRNNDQWRQAKLLAAMGPGIDRQVVAPLLELFNTIQN